MGRKPDPKYMPVCRQDIWPSPNAFSKKDWLTSIIYYTGNVAQISTSRYIWHGAALTNVALRRRVHEIHIGVTQKVACCGKPSTF